MRTRKEVLDDAIARQASLLAELREERDTLESKSVFVRYVNATRLSLSAYAVGTGLEDVRVGDVVVIEGSPVKRNGAALAVVQRVERDGVPRSQTATEIVGHVADSWRCS